jgi:hypothetical protein
VLSLFAEGNRISSAVEWSIAITTTPRSAEVSKMYEFRDEEGILTWTGEKLKFYYDDHNLYATEYAMGLSEKEARAICKKLCRHFKVRVWLGYHHKRNGCYRKSWTGGGEIYLPMKGADLGLLCHEIAHAIHHQKYHKKGHTKQLRRILDRVIGYVRKKNHWRI